MIKIREKIFAEYLIVENLVKYLQNTGNCSKMYSEVNFSKFARIKLLKRRKEDI